MRTYDYFENSQIVVVYNLKMDNKCGLNKSGGCIMPVPCLAVIDS